MRYPSILRIMAAVSLLLFASHQARAAVIINTIETVSGVELSASGTLDLTGLTNFGFSSGYPQVIPGQGYVIGGGGGGSVFTQIYSGLSGPATFGTGGQTLNTSASGDFLAISNFGQWLSVANGFVSGSTISSSTFFSGATIASLGMGPGTYTWTWSTDSVSLVVPSEVAEVPGPPAFALFCLGLAGLGAAGRLRKRR